MTTLSTHVLDIERGVPAVGMRVTLYQGDAELGSASTNADGRIPDFGVPLSSGVYELAFDLAAYFANQGRSAPFLRGVRIAVEMAEGERHYHVPLLMSPYACTSYRGS